MSLEWVSSHIDGWLNLKDTPEYQKKLDERVKKVEKSIEYSKQLTKPNDILNILDLPDEQEKVFRNTLEKQKPQILKELAKKSKWEIITFVINKQRSETNLKEDYAIKVKIKETKKRWIENEKIDNKLSKIKSVFTDEILAKSHDIAQSFEALNLKETDTPEEKEAILKGILNLLKEPWVLKSIIDDLGWADENNPNYVKFRNTLIGLDYSFNGYFPTLENTNFGIDWATNEVVNSIEKGSEWLVKIDLNSGIPISKMSLIWSNYSFDKEIDKQVLSDIQEANINKLTDIQNSFAVLQGLYNPFNKFINQIKQNWWKQDLKQNIKSAISNFSKDIFNGLADDYETMWIKSDMQLTESDILSFASIDSPNDLKLKIDNIKEKFHNIETQAWKMKAWVFENHKSQMKEFLEIKSEQKEKQKKVLEFMRKSGFDLIPKEITNRIIRELQSNTLTIPWFDLSVKNINLKNWNFWENGAFIDKEAWLNIGSKTNLVKFMNKVISWNVDEPLSVEAIANGVSIADPNFLKHKFLEANIVGSMGWNYNKVIDNLKKAS